ncbi:hypothetical protein ANO11243_065930 [Dothideomycetidae sp. 11243]|nr:hypothetical protein ANO11243_065930 [fungal sp. No.11243]
MSLFSHILTPPSRRKAKRKEERKRFISSPLEIHADRQELIGLYSPREPPLTPTTLRSSIGTGSSISTASPPSRHGMSSDTLGSPVVRVVSGSSAYSDGYTETYRLLPTEKRPDLGNRSVSYRQERQNAVHEPANPTNTRHESLYMPQYDHLGKHQLRSRPYYEDRGPFCLVEEERAILCVQAREAALRRAISARRQEEALRQQQAAEDLRELRAEATRREHEARRIKRHARRGERQSDGGWSLTSQTMDRLTRTSMSTIQEGVTDMSRPSSSRASIRRPSSEYTDIDMSPTTPTTTQLRGEERGFARRRLPEEHRRLFRDSHARELMVPGTGVPRHADLQKGDTTAHQSPTQECRFRKAMRAVRDMIVTMRDRSVGRSCLNPPERKGRTSKYRSDLLLGLSKGTWCS